MLSSNLQLHQLLMKGTRQSEFAQAHPDEKESKYKVLQIDKIFNFLILYDSISFRIIFVEHR